MKTGKRVWHQQLVKHDIWNYDTPTAPVLLDVNVNGRRIPGLFQITKQSWVYSYNRHTGEPIWPIVDRPAPQSLVPGEKLPRTQPHVTKPAPYDLQGRTEAHLIDYTPEIRKLALERAQKLDLLAPLFAPPTHRGNKEGKGPANICPGGGGGANITGPPAADPSSGVIFIASTSGCSPTLLAPATERDNDKMTGKTLADVGHVARREAGAAGGGQRSAGRHSRLFKGPVGRITAIDMNTGEHLWMIPHGDTDAKVSRTRSGPTRCSRACRTSTRTGAAAAIRRSPRRRRCCLRPARPRTTATTCSRSTRRPASASARSPIPRAGRLRADDVPAQRQAVHRGADQRRLHDVRVAVRVASSQ